MKHTLESLPQRLALFQGDERVHLVYRRGFDVKNLCCTIKSSIFEKWGWEAPRSHYPGVVKRWGPKKTGHLVIQFEGDDHGMTCDLAELLLPDFDFDWIDYADGQPRPRLDRSLLKSLVPHQEESVEQQHGRAAAKAKVQLFKDDVDDPLVDDPLAQGGAASSRVASRGRSPGGASVCSGGTQHFDESSCASPVQGSPARTQSEKSSKVSSPSCTPPSKKGRHGGASAAVASAAAATAINATATIIADGTDSSDGKSAGDSEDDTSASASAIDSNDSSAAISESDVSLHDDSTSETSSSEEGGAGRKKVAGRFGSFV